MLLCLLKSELLFKMALGDIIRELLVMCTVQVNSQSAVCFLLKTKQHQALPFKYLVLLVMEDFESLGV